jgi:hypothetical protein
MIMIGRVGQDAPRSGQRIWELAAALGSIGDGMVMMLTAGENTGRRATQACRWAARPLCLDALKADGTRARSAPDPGVRAAGLASGGMLGAANGDATAPVPGAARLHARDAGRSGALLFGGAGHGLWWPALGVETSL